METRVVNLYYDEYDVYIGRPSKWGNPFRIGIDGTREEVIRKYYRHLKDSSYLMNRIVTLRGKRLGCFCKPKPCHGDMIVKALVEMELETFFD